MLAIVRSRIIRGNISCAALLLVRDEVVVEHETFDCYEAPEPR